MISINKFNTFYKNKYLLVCLISLSIFVVFNKSIIFNFNYGDQPNENILLYNHITDYSSSHYSSLENYLTEKANIFFDENKFANKKNFNINFNFSGQTYIGEEVKALQRSIIFLLNSILKYFFEIEQVFQIKNVLLIILNSIILFKFGSKLFDKKFGYFLVVFFNSNVFYQQLLRSSMEDQTLYFITLFALIYIYLLNFENEISKLKSQLFLGFIFSLCLLNGYPNTIVFLPFISILYISLIFIIKQSINFFTLSLYIGKIIFFSLVFYIFLSGLYSLYINEDFFYHISLLGVRFGSAVNLSDNFLINNLSNNIFVKFSNLINNIIIFKNIYHYPHEPGMLLHYSLFNYCEFILVIFGIFFSIYNKLNIEKKIFFITISLYFIFRILIDDNVIINKSNFDYHFLLIIYLSFGLYQLVNLSFFKEFINRKYFMLKNLDEFKDLKKVILLNTNIYSNKIYLIFSNTFFVFIIFLSIYLNYNTYNNYFIKEFNLNLGLHNGIFEIKKLIFENNFNNEKTFIILDYDTNRFDPFRPELIHQYKYKGNFITYKDFLLNSNQFVNQEIDYDNLLFIFPGYSYNSGLNTQLVPSKLPLFTSKYINNFKDIYYIKDNNSRVLFYIFIYSHKQQENILTQDVDFNFFNQVSKDFDAKKVHLYKNYSKEIKKFAGWYNIFYSSNKKNNYLLKFNTEKNIAYIDLILSFIFFNDTKGQNYLKIKLYDDLYNIISAKIFRSNKSGHYGIFEKLHTYEYINYVHIASNDINKKNIILDIELYNSDHKNKSSLIINKDGISKYLSFVTLIYENNDKNL